MAHDKKNDSFNAWTAQTGQMLFFLHKRGSSNGSKAVETTFSTVPIDDHEHLDNKLYERY